MAVVGYIDGYVDENNNEHGLTDTVAQGLITAIKDGSSIDSFGDVETALADKPSRANVIANTQLIADTVGWSGKNKAPNTATSTGIFTVNSDGTVTVNGTPSSQIYLRTCYIEPNTLPSGDYILSGCPDTGSSTTYEVQLYDTTSGVATGRNYSGDTPVTIDETHKYGVLIYVRANVSMSNKLFKPMLRKANILDPTYEPYRGTTAVDWESYAKTGVHNILDPDFNPPSFSGVDDIVTLNNGILTLNGTRASSANYAIKDRKTGAKVIYLPKGTYTFYALGADWENGVQVGTTYNNAFVSIAQSGSANDRVTFTVDDNTPSDYKLADGSVLIGLYVKILLGTYSDKIIKPMLCVANDTVATYAPYAMTNRELTLKPITITPATGAVVTNNVSVKNGVVTKIIVVISKDGDAVFFEPSASIGSTVTIGSVPENCKPSIPITGANTNGNWLYVWFISRAHPRKARHGLAAGLI